MSNEYANAGRPKGPLDHMKRGAEVWKKIFAKREEKKRQKLEEAERALELERPKREKLYKDSLTRIPFGLERWANIRLLLNGREKMAPTDYGSAKYAYDLQGRRGIYRLLDIVLFSCGVRTVPIECTADVCQGSVPAHPTLTDDEDTGKATYNNAVEVWKLTYAEALSLVRHDDRLNWQKFNYIFALFGVLIAAFNLASSFGTTTAWMPPLICLAGLGLSWAADLTFQEGLRCLRGHKRKVSLLEKNAPDKDGRDYLFYNNAFNQRDVLEAGPAVMFLTFLSLGLYLAAKELFALLFS